MDNQTPGTAPSFAQPRNMRLERQGVDTVPMSRVFPEIRCGQCEFCGVIDPHQPAHFQYKLCPHYRGMEAKCIYCPQEKDQVEVVRAHRLLVREHPYQPGTLIMLCNSTECEKKHQDRFKISR